MEVVLPLNNFRKLGPHLGGTFEPALTGEDGDDVSIPVSTAVFNFPGCIRVVSQYSFVVYSNIPPRRDVQECVIIMFRLPYLIGITFFTGLIKGITPALENLGKSVGIQPADNFGRGIRDKTVCGHGVDVVSHIVELVDTADQHTPDKCRGIRSMVGACYT